MITTTWTIAQLERTLPECCVTTAHWRVTGVDGDHSGSVYGTISFPHKDHNDPTFIPYDNLTEAQVIQWVKDEMGADTVAAHEASIAAQIDAQKNPTTAAGVPWAA